MDSAERAAEYLGDLIDRGLAGDGGVDIMLRPGPGRLVYIDTGDAAVYLIDVRAARFAVTEDD